MFFIYIFGALYVATMAILLACVTFALVWIELCNVGRRLSFQLRQAFGLCRNKFRNTKE